MWRIWSYRGRRKLSRKFLVDLIGGLLHRRLNGRERLSSQKRPDLNWRIWKIYAVVICGLGRGPCGGLRDRESFVMALGTVFLGCFGIITGEAMDERIDCESVGF